MLPWLHLVTDAAVLSAPGFAERAARVLAAHGAALALHLRGHGLEARALFALAAELGPVAREHGALLLVNDRVDVALAARADGVQLGRRSLPIARARTLLGGAARIGYSAHDAAEAALAETDGADFVLLGTIYDTPTHAAARGGGAGLVRETAVGVNIPVLAIGGVTPERVPELLAAGAYGVAVVRAVWHNADPVAGAAALRRALAG